MCALMRVIFVYVCMCVCGVYKHQPPISAEIMALRVVYYTDVILRGFLEAVVAVSRIESYRGLPREMMPR